MPSTIPGAIHAHEFTLDDVTGFISDYQINLLMLFKLVYVNAFDPSQRLTDFINNFYDTSRSQIYRYVPATTMNFQCKDLKLDAHTLLSVNEIFGFIYGIATRNNAQMLYRFARFHLQHNTNGLGLAQFEHKLVCPIKVTRLHCHDEWIHGFLHRCYFDAFMTQFSASTHAHDWPKIGPEDTHIGIIIQKSCVVCAKVVMLILQSDDNQLMIVKFHICSHPGAVPNFGSS